MLEKVPSSFTSEAWPESWLFKCLYWLPKYRSWPNTKSLFSQDTCNTYTIKTKTCTDLAPLLFSIHGTHRGTYFTRWKKKVITSYRQNKKHAKLPRCKHDDLTPRFCEWAFLRGQSDHKQTGQWKPSKAQSQTGHRCKKCQFSEPDNKTLKVLDNGTL